MKNNRHFTDALFEEFDYLSDKVDNVLTEDLDTMLKYYNNLQNWDKQELLNFLTKDPTWNDNKEQGQYSKWILDKLNRNLLNSSHLGHLRDVLKRFEDNKKYLKNKDINKFKSVQEIDAHLNDDNSYNELSHSQLVRQHRKDKQKVDLNNEAKLIYEDSDWEIWIPETYAASCKLGQGSSWCTASTETSSYFEEYSYDGDLYIILNRHNKKEKYQFHFESESYMDINDNPIELLDFCENERTEKIINVLRQYDRNFDRQCSTIINDAKKSREEVNNFLQKTKLPEIIKYPTQKYIIEDFKKFLTEHDTNRHLIVKELGKIKKFKLKIENSIEEIEPRAFQYINNWIEQVIFEENSRLRSIGSEAFSYCHNITELELPNSITEIESGAFLNCNNLESIKLPNKLLELSETVFSGCSRLKNVVLPKNIKVISKSAFHYCNSLENITIPNSIISIEPYTFRLCTSLTNIIIPNNVTSIGERAFDACRGLISIVIPDSVTNIGKYAFYECISLESITIPGTVANIWNSTFGRCDSLRSVIIKDGVTSIESCAFCDCPKLTSIELPNSITNLESGSFYMCPNLVIKTSNPYVIEYCIKNNIKYKKID